ncbi:sensor histidine kinase [Methylobacterium oryzisoli]|uniref:sensor histidine kinase n=1 Tax=Methylobacterium oryzisoli TaxID=3385502 RepID=UPI00389209AD
MRHEDEERRRIARDLHDTTGQNLIAAGYELGIVERAITDPPPQVRAALAQARALLDASVAELRTLSYVLHPPLLEEAGLGVALATLADGFARRAGIPVAVSVAAEIVDRRWPPEAELALYRVAQEALTNVQRHAGATQARLSLRVRRWRRLELSVADGTVRRAASAPSPGLSIEGAPVVEGAGIRGMRSRLAALGGTLTVRRSGDGLRVTATLPLRTQACPGKNLDKDGAGTPLPCGRGEGVRVQVGPRGAW